MPSDASKAQDMWGFEVQQEVAKTQSSPLRTQHCLHFDTGACRDSNCNGGLSHSSHRDHASHILTDHS